MSFELDGKTQSIETFMKDFGITSLMVVKDGQVRAERYQYGNQASSKMVVQSVTKSVTSTALGIAIEAGQIASLEDPVINYIPELKGSPYGASSIRNLADMTPGVAVPTTEAPKDPTKTPRRVAYYDSDPAAVINWLKTFEKVAEPGSAFAYSDYNYYLLSLLIERAVGEPIEEYISKNIWEPAGMQYDAYMRTTHAGQVDGHGGMSMTLGDMARFGAFAMDSVKGTGGPHVSPAWFRDISLASTSTGVRAPGAIDLFPISATKAGGGLFRVTEKPTLLGTMELLRHWAPTIRPFTSFRARARLLPCSLPPTFMLRNFSYMGRNWPQR
ncbi:serine hydrolase domain-containing protein [Arthrobacter sp. SD76]|uniref:serine hydrolase domain-containing protein n=1 Tax=Arthrobacter sp. SD76 TaxID=3415007 RepID=UPI003C787A64